jgi:nicotinamidase-related amidase
VWRVDYQEIASVAKKWSHDNGLRPAQEDRIRVNLLLVDVQNTFCIPDFELFVAGRSGMGAVNDNRLLCEFIYRNLGIITRILPSMDTHQSMQIFHSIFLIDERGQHPDVYKIISQEEIEQGIWQVDPRVCNELGIEHTHAQQHLVHYTRELRRSGKYEWTVWPYHALLGGIGHALVSSVEEAIFFHSMARYSQPKFQMKGQNPLTESYSVLGPEVQPEGEDLAQKTQRVQALVDCDLLIIAGQAKSHCVAWTVEDLLNELVVEQRGRIYLLDDCTSPVVIPGVVDYTDQAEAAFARYVKAGVHVVSSHDPMSDWPDAPF